ncbi:sensor histidine kinase [Inhella gelatinilytica]|uniref:Histidine kinase n=1 Tax=Inhella gelatinilytica TaxID=2795030 RepID=A0A931IV25_9BURK|nr:histidine kinase [Inhella gelatinilytica]MBH9551535.1 histidine kinase [Inhella gelatinilytica]
MPSPPLPHAAEVLASQPLTRRGVARAVGGSLLFWSLVTLALAVSAAVDQQRAGRVVTVLEMLARFWPTTLPQMGFTALIALVLQAHPEVLERPRRVLAVAAVGVPLYLLIATPLVVLIQMAQQGQPLARFPEALGQWPAINVWIDAISSSGALAAQLGWAYWRQTQRQQQLMLQTQADNLRLRLTLLQGQLEPHFLFNTLNSIAALVRGAERTVALQAISRLSDLLRYALRASQQRWVSVADELRFVDDYVALQRLRFGDALRWDARVEGPDWARWACPPLLLQPLVENAVRYGLEAAEPGEHADLSLVVRPEGRTLVLWLSNPRPAEAQLMRGHGLGLAKTRERLQVLYGDRARIETEASSQRFELCLRLPLEDLDAALDAVAGPEPERG